MAASVRPLPLRLGFALLSLTVDSQLHAGEPAVRVTLEGHTGDAQWAAFSPDGKTLATADQKKVRLWDIGTGKCIADFGSDMTVGPLAFSPDGKTLATAGVKVTLYDVATRKRVVTLDAVPTVHASVAFSPDGKLLATGAYVQQTKLWDPETGKCVATLNGLEPEGMTSVVHCVSFSPDGKTLAIGGLDKAVRLWDVATRTCIATLDLGETVYATAYSPDGKALATGDCSDTPLRLWDVRTRRRAHFLKWPVDVLALAFSLDGRTLATGSLSVQLWDPATGVKGGRSQRTRAGAVKTLAFSPDGKSLVVAGNRDVVELWDVSR